MCYSNLHQGGDSIRDKKTNIVVAYADNVLLENCVFKVSEKGWQKVIEEKRKRVYAFIEGDFIEAVHPHDIHYMDKIYYNPYVTPLSTYTGDGSHLLKSALRYCVDKV